jgi:hypothetical protein
MKKRNFLTWGFEEVEDTFGLVKVNDKPIDGEMVGSGAST